MDKKDTYLTRDLYEASLLYTSHIKLIGLEREGNAFWFVFEDESKAKLLSDKYWKKDARVDALSYSEAVRSLKDRLFTRKG